MNWGSPSEFFAMGGYGLYVWGSYLVTVLALVVEVVLVLRRGRTSLPRAGRSDRGRTRTAMQVNNGSEE